MKPPRPPAEPLAYVFAELWDVFLEGGALEAFDIERIIEMTGLAAWREATEDDVKNTTMEIEAGDPILCLTEEGKEIVMEGRKTK
jgi:hypothetical protein